MQAVKTKEEAIEVRGARVHNLKNISFRLPVNQLTVVTGVSGSGKSSLAFDTVYAEGQRRYVESLSAYARQFLERMDKPDVDEIIGIAPAIAIRQKNQTRNPRSTVATQTEIYDYLRLLFARIGQTFCHVCGREVKKDSPESAADEILAALPEGARFYVLFSRASGNKIQIETKDQNPIPHLMSLMQQGFHAFLRDGETIELQKPEDYQFKDFQNTFVLIDRLKADKEIRQRLVDSLETCFREEGSAIIQTAGENPQTLNFSEKFICKYDGTVYEEPEPRLFSFNSPFGACPLCQGFGNTVDVDYALVVPNENLSLERRRGRTVHAPQYDWARKS
jgi:excinuclease ABC subunit A